MWVLVGALGRQWFDVDVDLSVEADGLGREGGR